MKFDPQKRRRRSIRLADYDYAQPGAYFVTVCAQGRECLFGEAADGAMRLNGAGRMVKTVWEELPGHYPGVETDAFVVMPNHVHAIVVLVGAAPRGRLDNDRARANGQPRGVAPTLSLPDVVHRFKTMTTKRYADGVKTMRRTPFPGRLWQRNYYEHIIRDEAEWGRIREYIETNPACWAEDRENPHGKMKEYQG